MAGIVEGITRVSSSSFDQDVGTTRVLVQIFCDVVNYIRLVNFCSTADPHLNGRDSLTFAMDYHPGVVLASVDGDIFGRIFCFDAHIFV